MSYFFESLDFTANGRKLNAYHAEFQPVSPEDAVPHVHEGAEFLHVLSGRLVVAIGRTEHELDEGDSIYFDASVPHSYRRKGRNRCSAMVVTTA